MSTMPRRTLLSVAATGGALLGAGSLLSVATSQAQPAHGSTSGHRWVGAGPLRHVYDPSPADGPRRYLNDHCTIKAPDGTWHLFSIIGDTAGHGEAPDSAVEDNITHATAPDLNGPWTTRSHALTTDPDYHGEDHLWAPHVIEHDGTYYMFYSAGSAHEDQGWAINLATSTDLSTWTRSTDGPLFRNGGAARDPMVVRVGDEWAMYYTEVADSGVHIVAVRTATDLYEWSEARAAWTDEITEEESVSVTESPFLVERDGWWYLFIGTRNGYVGTDVFASKDPFSFTLDGYAGHIPAHCAEIVQDGDAWWVTAAGWFQKGLHLGKLRWREAPPLWHSPDNPVAALDMTAEVRLFALAEDRSTLITRTLDSQWRQLGSDFATVPTATQDAGGRLHVFALRPNGKLAWCAQANDGEWSDWQQIGGPFDSAPAVALDSDDRLALFVLGQAGSSVQHTRQTEAGSGTWSDWEEFGGPAGAPPVVTVNSTGDLEVFAAGAGGINLAHRRQSGPDGWGAWDANFGGATGAAPVAALGAADRLQVMAIAPMGLSLQQRFESAPGEWNEWKEAGPWTDTGTATMIAAANGRLEAFYMPPAGSVIYHRRQNDDGSWGGQEEFGEISATCTPSSCVDAEGKIHLFAVAPDGIVHTRAQSEPDGEWSEWQALDGNAVAVVPAGSAT